LVSPTPPEAKPPRAVPHEHPGSGCPPLANAPFVVELGAALVVLLNQVSPAELPLITPPAPMFTKTNERGVKVTVFVFE
jgi:hypothetical protein